MNKSFVILALCIFVSLFAVGVKAQSGPTQVTITVISDYGQNMPNSAPPNTNTKTEGIQRHPTADDIIDAMKKKKQVTVVIPMANDTARWAHAIRIRSINATAVNETDPTGVFAKFNVTVYDPTDNKNYTTTLAYYYHAPDRVYLNWYGWVPVRDVITVHKTHVPPRRGSYLVKPFPVQFGLLPLLRFKYFSIL